MIPQSRTRYLPVALAALALVLAAASTASAAGYGEVLRFGPRGERGKGKKQTQKGSIAGQTRTAFNLEALESSYGIVVDPEEGNAVFVLDEPTAPTTVTTKTELEEITHHERIQKFVFSSTKKAYEVVASASFDVTSPATIDEAGEEGERMSNLAIGKGTGGKGVVYVLSEEPRPFELQPDEEAPVATTLFAFKTENSG